MFGFLKDKLKKAVAAFSKSAESEVKEEKVDDAKAIERAKEEEKRIVKKVSKPVEKKPAEKISPKPSPKPSPQKKEEKEDKKAEKKEAFEKQPVKRKEEPKKTIEKEKPIIPSSSPKKKEPDVKPAPAQKEKKEKIPSPAKEPEAPKKGFFSKLFKKEEKPAAEELEPAVASSIETSEVIEEIEEELRDDVAIEEHAEETAVEAAQETPTEEPEEATGKSGFFGKLKDAFTKKTLTSEKFDELFWELELAMLENNVAVEVIEKIKSDLRDELTSGKVSRLGIEDMITTRLRQSVEELFDVPTFNLIKRIKEGPRPFKICMIGVNGSGKTTTLAKLVHLLQKENLSCVVAASDTFRAAAIDQLKEHTDKLGVKLISQGYGADPAAVAFDAIKHAESKGVDVVLIDTAGRLHSNTNLMAELEKVVRVAKPDLKIFIGESITGNDCVEQATVFNKLVGIDAIILSKADIDEKGGAAISVSFVTGKPIIYLGMGQTYDDLVPFDKEKIIEGIGF